ncbi:La protein 1 [Zea mays]|uniref:La protein 1 n=1 Tax=Zea mays TaxID=4577 RepID=A0A3L6FCE7_MAIZE|nr:La protein 1 [Zea mays]
MATTSSRGEASSSSPPRKTLVLIHGCLLFGCGADWLVVSLALIFSFSRMRSHLGLEGDAKLETVPEETVLAVADILRRSAALRVSEDGKKVGRSKELLKPDEVIEQVDSRTVAASPLPYNVKLEEVESFFAQCGKTFNIVMIDNSDRFPHQPGVVSVAAGFDHAGRLFVGNVRSPGEAGEVLDGDRLRGSSGGLQFGWHQCASRKPLTLGGSDGMGVERRTRRRGDVSHFYGDLQAQPEADAAGMAFPGKKDLTEVTHKVYFDIEVDGKPTGSISNKKQATSPNKLANVHVIDLIVKMSAISYN